MGLMPSSSSSSSEAVLAAVAFPLLLASFIARYCFLGPCALSSGEWACGAISLVSCTCDRRCPRSQLYWRVS